MLEWLEKELFLTFFSYVDAESWPKIKPVCAIQLIAVMTNPPVFIAEQEFWQAMTNANNKSAIDRMKFNIT